MNIKSFLLIGLLIAGFLLPGTGLAHDPTARTVSKGPPPGARVLVIFVDSLRPDTVEDMARKGQLPNTKELFFDRGLRFQNFFTTYPALTVNAFSCLITGKGPDRSGMKAQSLFERFPTRKKSFIKRMFHIDEDFPRYYNMLTRPEVAPEVLKQNNVKALYDLLGEKYHTSVVPVSPIVAPFAWTHVAANDVDKPYKVTSEAAEKLDDLNGDYALRYMTTDTRGRLFVVWFTMLDEDQHRYERGQFGKETRKRMEEVDRWIGKIRKAFIRQFNGEEPYVVLFSDHGAYGGAEGIYNQPYYLARDFFYKILKMNVRGPDYTMHFPGTDLNSFSYIDNMGRGQARIFLPVGDSQSWDWSRPNTLYELRHYGLGPNRKAVDLIQELLNIDLTVRNQFPGKTDPHPVHFAFVKVSEDLIYVTTRDRGEALIQTERRDGETRYRYTPVHGLTQDASGKLTYQETFEKDPFGYLQHPEFQAPDPVQFLREYHDGQEWLAATYETDYPDAVTALARSFIWDPKLSYLAKSQDPDLCLSAGPGWNFRIEDINATDHGALLREAMHATLMISGPHIRSGVDPRPRRIIDLTPTLLQLIGYQGKTDMDSVPIEGIYEP